MSKRDDVTVVGYIQIEPVHRNPSTGRVTSARISKVTQNVPDQATPWTYRLVVRVPQDEFDLRTLEVDVDSAAAVIADLAEWSQGN